MPQVKVGSFTKSVGAAPVSQAITGVGFQPKVLIMWMGGGLTTDTFVGSFLHAFGMTTGAANSYSVAAASQDAVANSNASRRTAAKALTIVQWGESLLAECDLTNFDADGFTINWTTNDAVAYIIHYIALGGSDLTNAVIVNWDSPTAVGNKVVTGVGFIPDLVLHAGAYSGAIPSSSAYAMFNLGVMTAIAQLCISIDSVDAATVSNTASGQKTNMCIYQEQPTGGLTYMEAAYVSMNADGFTVNFTKTDTSNARKFISLCLKGGNYKLGTFNKVTGAAPASQPVTGVGFQPSGIILFGIQSLSTAPDRNDSCLGLGAASGAGVEQASALNDEDGQADMTVDTIDSTTKCFIKVDNTTPVVNAECDLTSFDSDGFTLNWTTNDGVATQILYIALGVSVQNQFARPDSDIAAGGWTPTPLWSKIDEVTPSDADYISSPTALGVAKLGLSNVTDPLSSSDHILRVRANSDGGLNLLTVRLYQEAVQICAFTPDLLTSYATFSYTLSAAEADSITDYSLLQLWLDDTNASWHSNVSWAEFEVPDAPTGANYYKTCSEATTLSGSLANRSRKILTQTATLGDAIAKALRGRTLTQTITLGDVCTAGKKFYQALTETLSLADAAISYILRKTKLLSETMTLSTVLSKRTSRLLTQAATLTDTISKRARLVRAEVASLLDNLSKLKSTSVSSIIYPVGVGDYTNIALVYPMGYPHWYVLDEQPTPNDSDRIYTGSTSEQKDVYRMLDIATLPPSPVVTVYFRGVKSGGAGASYARPILRLGAVETLGTQQALTTSYVTYSQQLARPGGGSWTLADINNLQVGVGLQAQSGYQANCTWLYAVVAGSQKVFTTQLSEALGVSDDIGFIRAIWYKTLTETISLAESFSKRISRTLEEAPVISDVISMLKQLHITLSESLNLSDTWAKGSKFYITLTDSTSLADAIVNTPRYVIRVTLTEAIALADSISKLSRKILTETQTIAGSIATAMKYLLRVIVGTKQEYSITIETQTEYDISVEAETEYQITTDTEVYPDG